VIEDDELGVFGGSAPVEAGGTVRLAEENPPTRHALERLTE
jgi:hypothetical protein